MKLTMREAQEPMDENGGSLNLKGREDIAELPENLTVSGNLDLRRSMFNSLPHQAAVISKQAAERTVTI